MAIAAGRGQVPFARRRACTYHHVLFLVIGAFLLSRRGVLAPVLSIGQGSEVQEVEEKIKGSKVFLLSKEYCPFCQRAKSILSSVGVAGLEVLELADMDKRPLVKDPAAIMDYMEKITGARTVPRLFIAGKFVGGYDDIVRMSQSGELQQRLKEADAL
ncbi:unnamed protein product [Cladocopium goreaui]|uniref:Diacylglycerol O-acyltransferase n=1 Tax=Cladocopium goreaui TaxID=2562237 RepID=A0A9P1CGK7_9DINO|nr:unnamed protein product [Cladocopium goreaui]